MGLKLNDLINCSMCTKFEHGTCESDMQSAIRLYVAQGKSSAQTCPDFTNNRVALSGEIQNKDALRFMLAGCSEFIMISGKTGKRLHYRLDKKEAQNTKNDKDQTNKTSEQKFIYWLNVGINNGTLSYAGVLYFDSNDHRFKFGKGARGTLTPDDIRVKSILYVLNNFVNQKYDINVKIMHIGKCGKCGKKLTDPESIMIGLGPVCAKQSKIPKYN